jgi:hypothetical protein
MPVDGLSEMVELMAVDFLPLNNEAIGFLFLLLFSGYDMESIFQEPLISTFLCYCCGFFNCFSYLPYIFETLLLDSPIKVDILELRGSL